MDQPNQEEPQRREYNSRIFTLPQDDTVVPEPQPPVVRRPYSSAIFVDPEE